MSAQSGRVSRRRVVASFAVSIISFALVVAGFRAPAAGAFGASQSRFVGVEPVAYTPNINDGIVYAIAKVGSWIVVGGSFTNVTAHGASSAVTRTGVLAFDQDTGALDASFAPHLDGNVLALTRGPKPDTVYVGGSFDTVNGHKSKSLALLSLKNGKRVKGFTVPAMNGIVDDSRLSHGHLWIVGSFTTLGNVQHQGIATLVPTTGAVDPYVDVQLTGHHNYNGSGAEGALGGRAMDINKAGTRAIVVGNFKDADGSLHDQIVMLDLGSDSATIDPGFNTAQFSAPCASGSFDTYVSDVDFAPNGKYFVVADTGGGGPTSKNTDGTRSLCDAAARFETNATGTDVMPTWVDYTGNDTLWSVTVTGTAVYLGGHQRWMNNPQGSDSPAAGSVPRPGLAAVDPVNGMPFAWNPGRNPRGAGAYAVLATAKGLYVGSDTDWIGDFQYERDKIAFFPLAGGAAPVSTATTSLPADVYQAGPLATNAGTDDLVYRSFDGTTAGSATSLSDTGVTWSTSRGAFVVGSTLFYGDADGTFHRADFNGTGLGTSSAVDPYDDPAWSSVATGSGQTYRGVVTGYYAELPSVTGAFYHQGRVYYSLSGQSGLYWRAFEPDSGVFGPENVLTGADFSDVNGMFLSGSTIYYAGSKGVLHTIPFTGGVPSAGGQTVSTPGVHWRARSLFVFHSGDGSGQTPTASATVHCSDLQCHLDGSGSTTPDGTTISSWKWKFGDGRTGQGETVDHVYRRAGRHPITLTVTNSAGWTNTWTGHVRPTSHPTTVSLSCARASVRVGTTVRCITFVRDRATAGAAAPTGSVRVTNTGAGHAVKVVTCTLKADASATKLVRSRCAITFTPGAKQKGKRTLTATYSGDARHAVKSGKAKITVVPRKKS